MHVYLVIKLINYIYNNYNNKITKQNKTKTIIMMIKDIQQCLDVNEIYDDDDEDEVTEDYND